MHSLDFSALLHNANFFKKLLGGTRLCAVVKNNAYGHGAKHIVRYLDNVVDFFAVGNVNEAKEISFASKDILILLPTDEADCEQALNGGFVVTVDSFKTLDTVCCVAARLNKKARIHIKINSGMSRLGFDNVDMSLLIDMLRNCRDVIVEGVFSHFYGDNEDCCNRQYELFAAAASCVETGLGKHLIKHIANSVGALLSRKYHMDMARIGLGLYGYGDKNLMTVKTVCAKVIAVRNINLGDVAGYGGRYIAPCKKTVAVVNVGYAQGFSRSLVGVYVQINGVKCPVIAVCMAMILVDVSATYADIGDEVVLLGNGVDISNDIVSVYELLCNLE